jgi:superfamily II DNA or RNA helicase
MDLDIDLQDAPAPKYRRIKAPAAVTSSIFKKDLGGNILLTSLRKVGSAVAAASTLTTAYFIPRRVLEDNAVLKVLQQVLTAQPKSKKFQGRETRTPWPLWHERGDYIVIPRQFGVDIFGKPAIVRTNDGLQIDLTVACPLLTATTCKALNGIDQETAVTHVEQYLRQQVQSVGFGACIFCISPGYGKTSCAAHLIQRLGRKALFVVPNEPFMVQVAAEMRKFLGDTVRVGTLSTSVKRNWDVKDKDIVVAMAKSVATISYDLSEYGTVIVDEAHEYATDMYSHMFYRFGAQHVILLTATPERAADHCGAYLEWLAGPVRWLEKRDISKLRWGGVDVTTFVLRYEEYPLKEVILKSGEPYLEAITRQIVAKPIRNKFMVEHVLLPRLREGRRIIVLGTRVEHMETIVDILQRVHKVDTGIIVGTHSDGTKATAEDRQLAQTKPILFASISIACKALNIPELSTLVLLSGGSYVNATFWEQAIGRITRDHPDKHSPELVLIKDTYSSKIKEDGMLAACVDAACKTLLKYSPDGFRFNDVDVSMYADSFEIE